MIRSCLGKARRLTFPGLKPWAVFRSSFGRSICSIAPEGLKNLAQGFNPGKHPIKRFALKGREMAWAKCPSNATEKGLGIS